MKNKKFALSLMTTGSLLIAACGSDTNRLIPGGVGEGSGSESHVTYKYLDTGSTKNPVWAYFDLDEGKVVAQADGWDIAVNRMSIKVQDTSKTAIADENTKYYNNGLPVTEQFQNPVDAVEIAVLYAATDVAAEDYVSNGVKTAIDSQWYSYNFQTHAITANTDNYYIIASAEDDKTYAKMRASNVTDKYLATFEFYVEQSGDGAFSDTAASIDISLAKPAQTCLDFQTVAEIDCGNNAWDVKFDIASRSYKVLVNGGVSGDQKAKAYGPVAANDFSTGAAQGLAFAYVTDKEGSIFTDYPAWQYLTDTHQVLPNYRVYAIDFGDDREPVKVQFTNYYNAEDDSGQITMRYMSLSDDGK